MTSPVLLFSFTQILPFIVVFVVQFFLYVTIFWQKIDFN